MPDREEPINSTDELIDEYSIYASNEVKKVNMFSRLSKSINYLIPLLSLKYIPCQKR